MVTLNVYLLPLQNTPQKFNITLGGVVYNLTCRWNSADMGGWYINLDDAVSGKSLLDGVPLVAGADLLAQYGYLNFGGALVIYTDAEGMTPPTIDNLGNDSNLYYVVNAG